MRTPSTEGFNWDDLDDLAKVQCWQAATSSGSAEIEAANQPMETTTAAIT